MARDNKQGQKRRQPSVEIDFDGETEVDDMAVAASFAALTYVPDITQSQSQKSLDSNEIDVSEEEEDTNDESCSDEQGADGAGEDEKKEDANSDSDSDESCIDLSKERAEIEKMQEKEIENAAPPKTEHELDPYKTPLPELEKKFQLSLTVKDDEQSKIKYSNANLCLAGTVKSHLVHKRTIIVESVAQNGSMNPLDEGSLLVFRINEGCDDQNTSLIPLGRVFEIFGPVRQPLYTIRLPPPKQSSSINDKKIDNTHKISETKQPVEKRIVKSPNDDKQARENVAVPENMDDSRGSIEVQVPSDSAPMETNDAAPKENEKPTDLAVTHSGTPVGNGQAEDSTLDVPKEDKSNSSVAENDTPLSLTPQENDNEKEPVSEVDPWLPEGRYTKYLKGHPEMQIFYVQEEARLIDAESILRMSTKGCDASNVFDEEVANVNEMCFSDDEEERQVKGRRKGKKTESNLPQHRTRGGRGGGRGGAHIPVPAGFHQQPSHPPMMHPHMYQNPYPQQQFPVATYAGVPPPPPPPPRYHAHPQYAYPQQQGGYQAPPYYGVQPGQPYALQNSSYPGGYTQHQQQPRAPYYQYATAPGNAAGQAPPPPPPPPPPSTQNPAQQQSDTVYYY